MRLFNALSVGALALLTACGSGGGGGGSVTVVTPGPTPAPSPTPAPTPAPTPIASPFDLSRSLLFQPFSAELRIVRRYGQDTPPFYLFESGTATACDDTGSTILSWDPQIGEFGVRRGNEVLLYTRPDRTPVVAANGTDYLNYARPLPSRPGLVDYSGTGTAGLSGAATSYVVIGRETEQSAYFEAVGAKVALDVSRDFVSGLPTPASAVPTTGAARWQGRFQASLFVEPIVTSLGWTGGLDVDFATRTVRGTIVADQRSYPTGTQPLVVTLTLDATIDPATGRVTGTLRSADGAFAGRVLGRLFGPQASELGLVVEMTWQNGRQPIAGTLIAAR